MSGDDFKDWQWEALSRVPERMLTHAIQPLMPIISRPFNPKPALEHIADIAGGVSRGTPEQKHRALCDISAIAAETLRRLK